MSKSSRFATPVGALKVDYIEGLYGYAMLLTRDGAQADDLVQQTYSVALESASFSRENNDMKGWLFTILRKVWLEQVGRCGTLQIFKQTDKEVGLESLDHSRTDAHESFVRSESGKDVRTAMERIPFEFREVIILREFLGLSYEQMARVLGCPAEAVMSRLERARYTLRTMLVGT